MSRRHTRTRGTVNMNDRDTRLAMQLIGFTGFAVLCVGVFVEQVLLR